MKERELLVELIKGSQPNDTVFILGATGSGKTTLIANLARERKRFIIIDTKEDFPQSFFPEAKLVSSTSALRDSLNSGDEKIIVQLWLFPDEIDFAFQQVCDMVYQFHLLNPGTETTFILDETNAFVYVNHCPTAFADIIMRGRSVGIRKIFGAQWFGTIPTWTRDTFTEIYTFRHTDETGVSRLEQFGFDPEEVKDLEQYHCLYAGKGIKERISLKPKARQNNNIKT